MGEKINTIVDVLEREEFIGQVMSIVQRLKVNNQGMTFAVEGQWGIGKSFILDRVEEILNGEQDCLVLRYNCWEYDYYDEPLMAIVASFLDQIYSKIWKTEMLKLSARAAVDFIGSCLKEVAGQYVKDRLGFDLVELGKKEYEKALGREKADSAYDLLSGLKTALYCLRGLMVKVSGDKKLILLVDELDRCLPPYQIKILERLHHLFLGSSYVVVLAVNAGQLEETVHKLYGEGILTDKYLKKIISFSLKLDCGTVSEKIVEKYNEVLAQYPVKELATRDEVINFLKMLFLGLDIRTTEKIWEKAQLIHSLVFSAEEGRIDIFCFELLWLIAKEYKECRVVDDASRRDSLIDGNVLLKMYFKEGVAPMAEEAKILPKNMSKLFNDLVKSERYNMYRSLYGEEDGAKLFLFEREVLFRDYLVGYWCGVIEQERFLFDFGDKADGMREEYHKNIEKLKQFARLVEMMR
ncbi:MAG: KAP family NTPase [Anaerovibrio sp.]|uniref:KAP family P-loop NTPase fold protein n=1 Tax=Anaerovibrio sp. TaxID=1872532 RepID=UPI0025DFFA62|nr:P-loop NTPase fold protein [Anaerovibrio sp.]MCR5175826.1 KAP family NTPase [Anaerovibrio sp.]